MDCIPTNDQNSSEENLQTTEPKDEDIEELTMEQRYVVEIENLKREKEKLTQEVKKLNEKFFNCNSLQTKPEKFIYYTGITPEKFTVVFNFSKRFLQETSKEKLSLENQLLMTLIKLRLDLQFTTLADLFNASKTTLHSMFWKWVDVIYFKMSFLIAWPDHEASMKTLPPVFSQYFPRLTGIIDCTEIFIHRPKNLKARAQVYSNYKKHSTAKFLIACTPHGSISFLSKAWGGRVSDVELVKNSGLISQKFHHHRDQILADRGFTLVDEFAAGCGVELIIPSFTKGKNQLSAKEVETTRQIASIRIHIERVIGLIKKRFTILRGPLPITMIKSRSDEKDNSEFSSLDKIVTVCAVLTNLGDSIVYKEKPEQ